MKYTDLTIDQIDEELKSKYFVNVPVEFTNKQINSAMASFEKFLELPENIKKHIDFSISEKHRRSDVGYKSRKPEDDIYNDSKEFFHYHPAILKKYPEYIKENKVVKSFLDEADSIWRHVDLILKHIFSEFDKKFTGVYSSIFDTENPHIVVRFLQYNWNESGKFLAKPHFDAGAFTFAIAESCPGLRIGSCPDDIELVKHQDSKAIFMLSSNSIKLIDDNELKPAWHDVVQMDETNIGKEFARWAIVVFIDAHGVEALPRSETHKWYNGEV